MAKLLVIGGTRFTGYFAVKHALERGHQVTLFNRGKSDPGAFPEVEQISGDRDSDIDKLRGRQWDAVIDTCGYTPRVVRKSAELLADAVGYYVFMSSGSVYAEPIPPNADETAAVQTLSDPSVEDVTGDTYGGLKALCERVVDEVFAGRSANIRSGLMVGPRDGTNRFDYWVERVAEGGEVLAPGSPMQPAQFIDARDLGEWLIHLVDARICGTFNAICVSLPFGDLLETCKAVSGSAADFTWVDEAFLLAHEVQPWGDLPLWLPAEAQTFLTRSNARAVKAGLTFRPLAETVRDTLTWMRANPSQVELRRTALTRERESAVLQAWRVR